MVYRTTDDPDGTQRLFTLPYARIFSDGFEVGGVGDWSATTR